MLAVRPDKNKVVAGLKIEQSTIQLKLILETEQNPGHYEGDQKGIRYSGREFLLARDNWE